MRLAGLIVAVFCALNASTLAISELNPSVQRGKSFLIVDDLLYPLSLFHRHDSDRWSRS